MNVCMLAYTFYESDNRVRRYAEALAKRGDRVDAIVLRREGQPRRETVRGVHVYRIQRRVRNEQSPISYLAKLLIFLVRSAIAVTLLHLKRRYDVIHVHSVPDFEVFATILPRLMGAKVILDIHDIVPEFYASKFKVQQESWSFRALVLLEKLSTAYCNFVIIANHLWYTKLVERSVTREKCAAIINYPDLTLFPLRESVPDDADRFVMCYPGTLNWHQGVDRVIRAMALLRETAPQLRFLIVGDGPDREKLRTLIQEEQLESQVTLLGSVPMEEVANKMATVHLGIVPKRKDSFGNEAFSTKIMEFMASGVPVLVADTRVDQYYFNDQVVQFFDANSVSDLAAKILELMQNPGRRDSLRRKGVEFIEENNWAVRSHEYFEIVDNLAGQRKVA